MMRWSCGAFLIIAVFASGCGYTWQGTTNRWTADRVNKIYVKMLVNNTLRPGIEVPFTSAILKTFARGQRIKLVSKEDDADAVIDGTVTSLDSVGNAAPITTITQDPEAKKLGDAVVATEYTASANVSLRLTRKEDGVVLWAQGFNRSKIYPAGNRFGLQGTTSALINSSQEYLAVANDIADFIASDAYDTMMEAF